MITTYVLGVFLAITLALGTITYLLSPHGTHAGGVADAQTRAGTGTNPDQSGFTADQRMAPPAATPPSYIDPRHRPFTDWERDSIVMQAIRLDGGDW